MTIAMAIDNHFRDWLLQWITIVVDDCHNRWPNNNNNDNLITALSKIEDTIGLLSLLSGYEKFFVIAVFIYLGLLIILYNYNSGYVFGT